MILSNIHPSAWRLFNIWAILTLSAALYTISAGCINSMCLPLIFILKINHLYTILFFRNLISPKFSLLNMQLHLHLDASVHHIHHYCVQNANTLSVSSIRSLSIGITYISDIDVYLILYHGEQGLEVFRTDSHRWTHCDIHIRGDI